MVEEDDDERRRGPGRREYDYVLEVFYDQMISIERRLRQDVENLDEKIKTLEKEFEGICSSLRTNIHELEQFHATERAKLAERVQIRNERQQILNRYSIRVGIIGGFVGCLAGLVEILNLTGVI